MIERRSGARPTSTTGYLQQLPALVLLDRMLMPVIAVSENGELSYGNPAFATMMGHSDTAELTGQPITDLLVGRDGQSAQACAEALGSARGTLVEWRHAERYVVSTLVSDSMLMRSTDPLLLVSLHDVTEGLWTNPRHP
ncbi:diguanylate cyclase [Mycolicibacterium madagascariense]|uniref:Diguanylate cyclase n=1 Tax=Mycolicibacterium madagascariense TaxID=212765 RepID=A0A7I7XNJ9_9MYCO|nr:PAS domain-containing protein [Mycolicibacterium madagascariense]MCV7012661.1 PAS domain-containing protein [Mycolicibacterium madagascariense]BBZ30817.1 diguanylate cyclase [Mycolicibacterium madagascariense]